MRHGYTQTIAIGKAIFQIVYLWMKARIALPKGHKAESESRYPRESHQARSGTITASHDEFEKNFSKAPTDVEFKICRAYSG